ncbi:SDR family NAD(P)-dependent oxidoreductase [Natrarchaeobius chitinivorans]|uniref:SDR family oxidoreductase n=1 Tax=Natrarchaeobius chitinivorans TaxID=1679083 RepID=A0A3N6P8A9_NATCH|nr:SDR family NAD(P)-dependent oxidoreductase [Natrarchaeobius chitinivorans]RQG94859.1 SDR family oxidoreductase [Natrarchaeobius chitinivorans]
MNFENDTVVITGGGSGIGKQMAERFAGHGAQIAIADVENASQAASELETDAIGVETDVTEEDDVAALREETLDAFGSIDVLVNNAAIYAPLVTQRDRSFDEIPVDEWRSVLDVNTTGTFICCQQLVPEMVDQGSGSVVNISSAVMYGGVTGYPHYVTSKGAIPSMTRAIATEVGDDGVRVNAIAPGLVTSEASQQLDEEYLDAVADHQCLPRNGTPEEVIDTVEYLASEKSSFITGSTIHPDGGSSFR